MAGTSKEYQLAIKIAGGVSSSFNKTMADAGNKLNNLGAVAKKAAAVAADAWGALRLGQFVSDAIDTYGEFEQSMANTAAVAGASAEEYQALEAAALAMGKATTKSASECADALGYMALANWDVETSIASLEPILRLSEATQMDLATCSDLVTDSMGALGIQVGDLSKYLDIATAANNSANTSSEAFMEAMIGCGGACKTVGVSLIDTSTAIGILANNGTKGSEAGTALNSMLARLSSNDAAIKAMESLGVSAFDASGEFVGLQNFLQKTQGALSNLSTEQQAYYLKQIAGANYFTEMTYLLDSVKKGADGTASAWDDLAGSLENSEGTLADMAAKITDTWQGAKAKLDSAVSDLKINTVKAFAPYMTKAINRVADAIPAVTSAAARMAATFADYAAPKLAELWNGAMEIFAAVRPKLEGVAQKGKAVFAFLAGAAQTAIQGIAGAVRNHSGLFGKLGRIAANIGSIIAGIWTRMKPVISYVSETALPAVAGAVMAVADKLAGLAEKITANKGLVIGLVSAFAAFKGITAISALGKNVMALGGRIASVGTRLAGIGAKVMAFVAANPATLVIAAIAAVIGIIIALYNNCEWFRKKADEVIGAVSGFLQAFWEVAKAVFGKVSTAVKNIWNTIRPYIVAAGKLIAAVFGAVVGFFTGSVLPRLKAVCDSVLGAFKAAWGLIKAVWEKVRPFFQALGEAIRKVFSIVAPAITGFFKAAWATIKATFSVAAAVLGGFFSTAWEVIKAVWNTVAGFFQAVFDTIAGIFSAVGAVLSGDFSGAWEAIKGIFGTWAEFFGTVWDGIKNVFGAVADWFGGVFSAAWEGIKSVFAGVGEFFSGIWETIVSLFTSIGTAVSDAIGGAVRGAINAVLGGAVGIINGFINAINFAIGVINKIPGVSIGKLDELSVPQFAKGGLVSSPTLLEAGEAGTEAIVPLSELWKQMQGMISESMGGVRDGILSLAKKLDMADAGAGERSIPGALRSLQSAGGDTISTADNSTAYQITYAPQYTFTGDSVSREEVMEAGRLSYEEFERYMSRYDKDNHRKVFT